jgi:hypothetical protein
LADLGVSAALPGANVTWLIWSAWLIGPAAISGALLSRRKVV